MHVTRETREHFLTDTGYNITRSSYKSYDDDALGSKQIVHEPSCAALNSVTLPSIRDTFPDILTTPSMFSRRYSLATLSRRIRCLGECRCQVKNDCLQTEHVAQPMSTWPRTKEMASRYVPITDWDLQDETTAAPAENENRLNTSTTNSGQPRMPVQQQHTTHYADKATKKSFENAVSTPAFQKETHTQLETDCQSALPETTNPDIKPPSPTDMTSPAMDAFKSTSMRSTSPLTCTCVDEGLVDLRPIGGADGEPMRPPQVLHDLFQYCPHTRRLGSQLHPNQARDVVLAWRQREPLTLADQVNLRLTRTCGRDLYGWGEKVRANNGQTGHVEHERERRATHQQCFAETDLRLPDFVMQLAQDNRQAILHRGGKPSRPGKDDLHLAMLILLDHDSMLIEELGQKCEELGHDLARAYEVLGQQSEQHQSELRRYKVLDGDLKNATSTSPLIADDDGFDAISYKRRRLSSDTLAYSTNANGRGTQQRLPSPDPSYASP